MAHRVTPIPGEETGQEQAETTRRVLEVTGAAPHAIIRELEELP